MRNLYEETVSILETNGKTLDDVLAVQGEDFAITIDNFVELAKKLDYDAGLGAAHVAIDLVIIGEDWWLERAEYDGSEWWRFQQAPQIKRKVRSVTSLGGDKEMWPRLEEFKQTNKQETINNKR